MLLNVLLVPLLCLVNLATAKTHHERDSHLTCGYANSTISLKYAGKHSPADVLVYKFSEVESNTTRLLPWHHSSVLTCHVKKTGLLKCTKFHPDGSVEDKFFPGKHSSIAYSTVTAKEYDYTVVDPGFYCVNSTVSTKDEQPVVFFSQKSKGGWAKTLSVAAVLVDFAFNIFVFSMIWTKYNAAVSQSKSLQVATMAMGCLLVAKVLGVTQWSYFGAANMRTMTVLTHVFSGVVKGLALSGFVGALMLLAFDAAGNGWQSMANVLLPVCLPVFVLTYADSVLLASYKAPRLPLYYPEGYRGWFPVIEVLILAVPVGYFAIKSNKTILRGPEKVVSSVFGVLAMYGVLWLAVVLRVFLSNSTYLDTAAQPPLVGALRAVEWLLKTALPAIALWSLSTKGRDSAFDSERQPLVGN